MKQHPRHYTNISDKSLIFVKSICSFGAYLDSAVAVTHHTKGIHTRGETITTTFAAAVSTRAGYKAFLKEWKRRYKFVSAAIRLARMERRFNQSWHDTNPVSTGYALLDGGDTVEALKCAARCLLEVRHRVVAIARAEWHSRPVKAEVPTLAAAR